MTERPNLHADLENADLRFHLHSQTDPLRHGEQGPLMIAAGDGPYVIDIAGKKYIDAVASLWCASLGFSNKRLAAAGSRALDILPVYHTFNHRSNPYCAELSALIAEVAPFPDAKVFFTDGGSEAIESAVKMAWFCQVARGRPEKRKIISRKGGFHGSTVLAAKLSGLPAMHKSFNLPDCNIIYAGRPHYYQDSQPGETSEQFAARLVEELEQLIQLEGPKTIAAFVAEPVMGAGGVIVPPQGYFPAIADLLKRNDILLISDEIICGFGRTGNWFGCQTLGFEPDMMTIAKGLSSGYAPIGGVVIAPHVFEALSEESHRNGVFSHGFTYSGHPVTAAIAVEALRIYREMDLPSLALKLGAKLAGRLSNIDAHPLVGNVRSLGFIAGIELMADRHSRTRFRPELKVGAMVERRARTHGLIIRNLDDVIAICPPFILTESEVDLMMDRLEATLDDVARELNRT